MLLLFGEAFMADRLFRIVWRMGIGLKKGSLTLSEKNPYLNVFYWTMSLAINIGERVLAVKRGSLEEFSNKL